MFRRLLNRTGWLVIQFFCLCGWPLVRLWAWIGIQPYGEAEATIFLVANGAFALVLAATAAYYASLGGW